MAETGDTVKEVRPVLTGSSCAAIRLKGAVQRPNSWESTLMSLCLGDTTFTWKKTDMNLKFLKINTADIQ